MKRKILTAVICAAIAITVAACANNDNLATDQMNGDSLNLPNSELTGARIYLYNRGRVTTEILASRIIEYEASDSTMAYVVHVDAFDSTGKVSGQVTADSSVIRETSGRLDMFGHVVMTTDDSTEVRSEYLFWNSQTDSVETDSFVTITKVNDTVQGWGLRADVGLKSYKILQATGTITNAGEIRDK